MKIGIISDTHGCHERWSLAYDKYFKDADMIIHAGDVLYHGPRNPMLVRGNCDSEVDTLVLDMPIQAPYTYVVAEGLKIVTTHGHYVETDEAKDKMAQALKADLFISGHVHINVLEKRGNTVFLNPGSPSLSKREDGRATVAVLEDKKISIIDINTDEVIMSLTL